MAKTPRMPDETADAPEINEYYLRISKKLNILCSF